MAFANGGQRGVKNDINVTPLVDVVLVLLIIFMVVTPMLQRGKDVHLPKAKLSDDSKKPDAVIVSVTADRNLWFESTQVTRDELRANIMQSVVQNPLRKVLVKGDDSLTVKDIRPVLIEAKAAGAHGVSLAIEEVKSK